MKLKYFLILPLLFTIISCNKDIDSGTDASVDFKLNWTKCLGTSEANDYAGSVVIGDFMYVTGANNPDGYQGDIMVSKIDLNTPSVVWSYIYDSGDQDLFISPSGNGHSNGGGGSRCIASDANGNIYITGASKDGFYNVFVMKIDASGSVIWQKQWKAANNTLANSEAKPYSLAVAGDKVFVIGVASGSLFSLVLDPSNGATLPETKVGIDIGATHNDFAYTVYSHDGNTIYVGGLEGAGNSAFIMRMSGGGATIDWIKKINAGYTNRITDIDRDDQGNFYYALDIRGVITYSGIFKTDMDGNIIWGKKIQGVSNDRNNISCIRVLNNQLYVGGRGGYEDYDEGQFGDGTFFKLSLDGEILNVYNYSSEEFETGERIEAFHEHSGNIILAGETWPKETGILGKWFAPKFVEENLSLNTVDYTGYTIVEDDGYTFINELIGSQNSISLYDPVEGSKGSADFMIHSIKF